MKNLVVIFLIILFSSACSLKASFAKESTDTCPHLVQFLVGELFYFEVLSRKTSLSVSSREDLKLKPKTEEIHAYLFKTRDDFNAKVYGDKALRKMLVEQEGQNKGSNLSLVQNLRVLFFLKQMQGDFDRYYKNIQDLKLDRTMDLTADELSFEVYAQDVFLKVESELELLKKRIPYDIRERLNILLDWDLL